MSLPRRSRRKRAIPIVVNARKKPCDDRRKGTAPMKVGLAGKMGAGKTTIRTFERKGRVRQTFFGGTNKTYCRSFLWHKKGNPGYRELMQKIGTVGLEALMKMYGEHLFGRLPIWK